MGLSAPLPHFENLPTERQGSPGKGGVEASPLCHFAPTCWGHLVPIFCKGILWGVKIQTLEGLELELGWNRENVSYVVMTAEGLILTAS